MGCIHHSDRGSQYAAQAYRALLSEHGLVGSMGRRGNPYDNAIMESFMKTLKVEGVYPMAEGRGRLSDGVRKREGRRAPPAALRIHRLPDDLGPVAFDMLLGKRWKGHKG